MVVCQTHYVDSKAANSIEFIVINYVFKAVCDIIHQVLYDFSKLHTLCNI